MSTAPTAPTPPSPRELARHLAHRAAITLGRVFVFVALVEIVAAFTRAVADPDPTPAVLGHLAAVTRAAYATLAALAATRLLPLSRALAVHPFALGAVIAFSLSAALALAPLFALVPTDLDDSTWDALLQILRAVTFVAGACLALLVARTIAARESQPLVARHLTWTTLPILIALPIAFSAIDPALSPTPWLPPLLAFALPPAMVATRLMRWDVALWVVLALVALAATVLFERTPSPFTLPAVALTGALLVSAIAAAGALHELAPSLVAHHADTISRTLIRRLFDGTLRGEGSRVGDLDPAAADTPPPDEAAEDAAHLARTLRELGIEPRPSLPLPPPPTEPPPAVIQPLVPKSRSTPRPAPDDAPSASPAPPDEHLAPVLLLPTALTGLHQGLRWCFAAFVARAVVTVFGLLLAASPLADFAIAVLVFDLALIASSALFVRGLLLMRPAPLAVLARPTLVTFALTALLLTLDLALAASRLAAPTVHPALLIADTAVAVAAVAAFLVIVARLGDHLRAPRLRPRARTALTLLSLLSALAAGTAIVGDLPASDLQWLSIPLGLTTALVGLGLWISLLWLTHDARDTLRP